MSTDVIREKLRALLGQGPATSEELHQNIKELENQKQLANLLYNMKKAGEIDRNDDRQYYLVGSAPKAQRAVETKRDKQPGSTKRTRRAQKGTAHRSKAAASRAAAGLACTLLKKLAEDAQRALDEYIYSVCDKKALGRLTSVRDVTRANLNESLAQEVE